MRTPGIFGGRVGIMLRWRVAAARDSIIHADSRAEWKHNGSPRKVAGHYRTPYGDVNLSDEQLKDAIQKTIQQVKWYDEKM